jgi:flagellar motor switch protein FliM
VSEVNLISVEQQSYGDYLKGLSDPTTIFTIASKSLRGVFAVEFNSSIAFPVIDRMLGGEGQGITEPRAATDLELKVMEAFLDVVTDNYAEAWKAVVELETEVIGRETRPQLLQIVSPNEIVATVVYQLQIGDAKGLMSICLPVVMLEAVIGKFSQSSYLPDNPTSPEATFSLLQTVSAAHFQLTAELPPVPSLVSDLLALSAGDVLRTNHGVGKTLNICVADSVKFFGRLAAADGRIIAQITGANEQILARAVSSEI